MHDHSERPEHKSHPDSFLEMFVFRACKCHDPVGFPCLASIVRERLLESGRICSDICETVPSEDGLAVKQLLIETLRSPVLELTDHRLCHGGVGVIGPVETPLVRLRIV